jgi:hypothetical protein
MPERFAVKKYSFDMASPEELKPQTWWKAIELEQAAFAAALPDDRSPSQINRMLGADNVSQYIATRVNPQLAVDLGRANPNQLYRNPLVVLVHERHQLVGYLYGVDNTSGDDREAKMSGTEKRYATLREAATHPDHAGRGMSYIMGYLFGESRNPDQPVTAYTWEELPGVAKMLRAVGLEAPDTASDSEAFGRTEDGVRTAKMFRFAGQNVGVVMQQIASMPGAAEAIEHAKGRLIY